LLDLLYARAVGARRHWFERHQTARRRLRRPVISVGNLSVGGTGKTPLVALLAEWLLARGERPAILSRGYGRAVTPDGVVVVSTGTEILADLDHAGDEPLMLAQGIPGAIVAVCEDRYLAGALAERRLGATVHLLDDGFQHVQLARDLDILVTSAGEIRNGRVLPFGRLRESSDAAARADLVVVLDADVAGARAEAWVLGISQAVGGQRRIPGADRTDASGAAGAGAVVAVAGIGNPQQFFDALGAAGWQVARTLAFSDHHRYRKRDVERIRTAVADAGARGVVTTEKDAVRFQPLGALPFVLVPVPMTLAVDGWELLTASVEEALVRARGRV
jgi:tetraacyldisaccharide 4'-kinase